MSDIKKVERAIFKAKLMNKPIYKFNKRYPITSRLIVLLSLNRIDPTITWSQVETYLWSKGQK